MSLSARVLTWLTFPFLLATAANAQQYHRSSAELLRDCAGSDEFSQGACAGYIIGAIDILEGLRFAEHVSGCIPTHKTIKELIDLFVNAMRANPAYEGNLPANVAITNIYRENCGRL
jgi:Rap1a immunity proteins